MGRDSLYVTPAGVTRLARHAPARPRARLRFAGLWPGGGARSSESMSGGAPVYTGPPVYTARVTENRRLSLPGLSIVRSEPMRWASSRVK